MKPETATFGAGCFWGVEETFRNVEGVTSTAVGYTGGSTESPGYREVCGGQTGHAEVVQVQFDPQKVSFEHLLQVLWSCHDPTTHNRQGPDVGSQYRSAIFYHSPEQQETAQASKDKLQADGTSGKRFGGRPVVTEITEAKTFYMAEDYHQQYVAKNGGGSCASSIG
jgi:peptide-methionine (S)-S-oxide reductase